MGGVGNLETALEHKTKIYAETGYFAMTIGRK